MYSFQLYFDFAGYSNLAIGTARLFGYRLPENFNRPYLKRNLREFWRSWHMSLTSWLRDYVYIPLGGSRRSYCRTPVKHTGADGGVWDLARKHLEFFDLGCVSRIGLSAVRVYGSLLQTLPDARLWNQLKTFLKHSWFSYAVSLVMTFIFVAVGWVFFFNSWEASLQIFRYVVSGY
jgi:alginate O-acetyltransferase complex protein AlgI